MTADITRLNALAEGPDAIITMMKESIQQLESGERVANKAIILFLDDSNGKFTVGWSQTGLRMSQCVSVCECGKSMFLKEMRYIGE